MKTYQTNHTYMYSNRVAFTMLELVFVIVVLGILASLAMPRLDRDLKQEASDSILSDIRYTQHMALRDNKQEFDNANWQRAFWTIGFDDCSVATDLYQYIGTDINYNGDIDDNEAANDPVNGKKMIWSGADCSDGGDNNTSDRIFITDKYGISSVTFTGGGNNSCSNDQYIGFDHLGRPHQGFTGSIQPDYASYLDADCTITFTMSDGDTFAITILSETGHAFIVGADDS
jgi:type II secretory pathway pseudopilin PulG